MRRLRVFLSDISNNRKLKFYHLIRFDHQNKPHDKHKAPEKPTDPCEEIPPRSVRKHAEKPTEDPCKDHQRKKHQYRLHRMETDELVLIFDKIEEQPGDPKEKIAEYSLKILLKS